MIDSTTWAVFVAAALVMLLTPGPAVMYIVGRSLSQGSAAGVVSSLGLTSGTLVHIVAAALGLSALLVSSATAFTTVKLIGAGYLVYLGIMAWRKPSTGRASLRTSPSSLRRVFSQGVVVNILNPKTALFFWAFLPQFADPARGSVAVQIILLGSAFALIGLLTDSGYALAAGMLGRWLARNPAIQRVQQRISGTIYLGLGVATAASDSA